MTLGQVLEQWRKGLQVEAKLSYREESSLIIHFNGELVFSYGVFVNDILGENWEIVGFDAIEECEL